MFKYHKSKAPRQFRLLRVGHFCHSILAEIYRAPDPLFSEDTDNLHWTFSYSDPLEASKIGFLTIFGRHTDTLQQQELSITLSLSDDSEFVFPLYRSRR